MAGESFRFEHYQLGGLIQQARRRANGRVVTLDTGSGWVQASRRAICGRRALLSMNKALLAITAIAQ
jgi:hypothetical protein